MFFDELVGSEFEPHGEGVSVVTLVLRDEHHGPHGFVHGGVYCTLAHQSAGAAAYSCLREGQEAAMVGMQINFVKPTWGGSLRSRSEVVKAGARTVLVETRITGDDGELRVTASSTFVVLERALAPGTPQ